VSTYVITDTETSTVISESTDIISSTSTDIIISTPTTETFYSVASIDTVTTTVTTTTTTSRLNHRYNHHHHHHHHHNRRYPNNLRLGIWTAAERLLRRLFGQRCQENWYYNDDVPYGNYEGIIDENTAVIECAQYCDTRCPISSNREPLSESGRERKERQNHNANVFRRLRFICPALLDYNRWLGLFTVRNPPSSVPFPRSDYNFVGPFPAAKARRIFVDKMVFQIHKFGILKHSCRFSVFCSLSFPFPIFYTFLVVHSPQFCPREG
jgi:hypothetical protein